MSFRAGYVGILGLANAGKSTLLNTLIGQKITIVSAKPQTTRQRVIGIHTDADMQICFVDTPGFIRAEKGLNQFLSREFDDVVKQVDAFVVLFNLDQKSPEDLKELLQVVKELKRPWLGVITKKDLPLLHREMQIREWLEGERVVAVSSTMDPDETKEIILDEVRTILPESPAPLFPEETFTTQTERQLAAEIIREKCFENLYEEVPFGLAVRIRRYDDQDENSIKVMADLVVSKENHKPMVIGSGGQKIKQIGIESRQSLKQNLGANFHLDLNVVVRRNWQNDINSMKEFGYAVAES